MIADSAGKPQKVNRAAPNAPSVIYDAVAIPGGKSAATLAKSGLAVHFVNEAYRHGKPMLVFGAGAKLLDAAGVPQKLADGSDDPGLLLAGTGVAGEALGGFIEALAKHRHVERAMNPSPV